ncbi:hypothetical protein [Hespellia stercorisuis]|uniref:DUF4367 domain-containing protein n=1 Tax=Hespellia stercorisuis DSM 15480 TaxID=1121950 RepID=A0A1M6N8B1_9FIRM|nr:hypothetical protein [Hespellia stercorisuis]SHJ91959.1 hypothetical protein SAMN02745243_01732 [Hespellia stercorisuis DSM 15480]
MDKENKTDRILRDLGEEIAIGQLEENQDAEFEGFQKIEENLLYMLEQKPKRKINKKKRAALMIMIAAVLGISVTAYATVKHFILHEDLVGNGEYNLNVSQEEDGNQVMERQPVRIIANYIPAGFISNNADYMEKYKIYPENGAESAGGITIGAEPATEMTISMANVTNSEDTMIGTYEAKILTTFMEDGSTGYNIVLFDQKAGYLFTIYGMDSGLSLDELKKIGENLSYEIVEDAEPITLSEEKEGVMTEEPAAVITEDNIFAIGETTQDVVAKDQNWMDILAEQGENQAAAAQVTYTVDSIQVTDNAPILDLENGVATDMYQENIQDDGTVMMRKDTTAQLNEETGKVETITEEHARKFVLAAVTLHNPTDTNIANYFFAPYVYTLTKEQDGYQRQMGASFSEPVYLGFTDYSGKAAYQLDIAAGETRTVTLGYVVDDSEVENAYLMFNSSGISDNSGTCWDNYVKITE